MTTNPTIAVTATRFKLESAEIAAETAGAPDAPLVIAVPGLSANLRSFDVILDGLDPARHRRLAFDPRGRGQSERTAAGTYGWPAHARDIAQMADQLQARTFDLIGWSMGAWIVMKTAAMFPGRVRKMVLIDAVGTVDQSVKTPVYRGLDRLDVVFPSREGFMQLAESLGQYKPWPAFQRLFDYELEDVEGGVRARSWKEASLEDDAYRDAYATHTLWPAVTMPALLVRALQPIPGSMPGDPADFGFVLPKSEYDQFLAEVPTARGVEVDAHHYNVGLHAETTRAIAEFLDE